MKFMLEVPPKIAFLAQMEALYLSGLTPDVVARRYGFKDWRSMHAAFLFAWELHLYLESLNDGIPQVMKKGCHYIDPESDRRCVLVEGHPADMPGFRHVFTYEPGAAHEQADWAMYDHMALPICACGARMPSVVSGRAGCTRCGRIFVVELDPDTVMRRIDEIERRLNPAHIAEAFADAMKKAQEQR